MATVTSDPLVQAVAGLIARHHTGCNQPVQPAPWMTAAADQIATAIIQHTTLDQTGSTTTMRHPVEAAPPGRGLDSLAP